MKTLRKTAARSSSNARGGTTLTEVLMSILCMGIGVVAVASLFPIALLRSVQATQLTSGTILRFNAETNIDLNRNIVYDPDLDGDYDEHFSTNYLVDPLGWNTINVDGGGTPGAVGNMSRFNFNIRPQMTPLVTPEEALVRAANFVTMPDSWITLYDLFPIANDLATVTLKNNVPQDVLDTFDSFDTDMDGVLSANEVGADVLRVILFSESGKLSEVRSIRDRTQISGAIIDWSIAPAQANLPNTAQYVTDRVSRVRIEVRDQRYSYLLTVRNFTTNPTIPQALVDVVIFFRRSPSLEEETTFTLENQDSMGVQNLPNGQYRVLGTKPYLKKGGFLLDTDTGTWHRIQKVVKSTPPVITLERKASGLNSHLAAFMKGVVEVYPLGTK